MSADFDTRMMARALQLARRGRYTAMPNPHVGCVLVRDGHVIGEGFTQPVGGNHAEIEALAAAGDATGATAYVTLEPCSHHGKTGPCAEALVTAGVSRVVAAMQDPLVVDLEISGSALRSRPSPRLPDLLAGAPARIPIELTPAGGHLLVRGRLPDGLWEQYERQAVADRQNLGSQDRLKPLPTVEVRETISSADIQ